MNTPSDPRWERLAAAARQIRDSRDTAAPYGFATRVAARAFAAVEPPFSALLAKFSWRALGIAALLAIASAAINYSAFSTRSSTSAEDDPASNEIINEIVNLS
jgi:hypothetical protein